MPAEVRPRRIRHLDTLRSVSRALYNMDQAQAEAWEMESVQKINEARASMAVAQSELYRKAPPVRVLG